MATGGNESPVSPDNRKTATWPLKNKPLPPIPDGESYNYIYPNDFETSETMDRVVNLDSPTTLLRRLKGLGWNRKNSSTSVTKYTCMTMSRPEAEGLLDEHGRHIDGSYLFRKAKGVVVLSICANRKIHHFKVNIPPVKPGKDPESWLDQHLRSFVKHHTNRKKQKRTFEFTLTHHVTYENAQPKQAQTTPPVTRKLSQMPSNSEILLRKVSNSSATDSDPGYDTVGGGSSPRSSYAVEDVFVSVPHALTRHTRGKSEHAYDDTAGLKANESISCPTNVWRTAIERINLRGRTPVSEGQSDSMLSNFSVVRTSRLESGKQRFSETSVMSECDDDDDDTDKLRTPSLWEEQDDDLEIDDIELEQFELLRTNDGASPFAKRVSRFRLAEQSSIMNHDTTT